MSENYKPSEWKLASLNHASDKRLVELTEAELRFLVSVIKVEITACQNEQYAVSRVCSDIHELCNPEDTLAQCYFTQLNEHKDLLRHWKSLNKKLSAIQAKLKRAR